MLYVILFISCRGASGPSGVDIQGEDVTPPTIQLTTPWPMTEIWENFEVAASAIDNVAIREVVFTIDGSSVSGDRLMIAFTPPYSIDSLRVDRYTEGWHFIAAYAYDTAGNVTSTPVTPIRIGRIETLQDTLVNLSYHNSYENNIWSLPDTARASAYWVKLPVVKRCYLNRLMINMSAVLNDSAEVAVEIWRGDDVPSQSAPDTSIFFNSDDIDTTMQTRRVDFGVPGYLRTDDFFVLLKLKDFTREDSLFLASDNGNPYWGRSGCLTDDEHFTIRSRYARSDNFMINAVLFYPPEELEEE